MFKMMGALHIHCYKKDRRQYDSEIKTKCCVSNESERGEEEIIHKNVSALLFYLKYFTSVTKSTSA